jgi:hypothetical protein
VQQVLFVRPHLHKLVVLQVIIVQLEVLLKCNALLVLFVKLHLHKLFVPLVLFVKLEAQVQLNVPLVLFVQPV